MAVGAANGAGDTPAVEYLSDVPERILHVQQGWGQLGIDVAAHAPGQQALNLRTKDEEYAKGLGHHAPGEIVVDLEGLYESFEAEVGVQWQGGNVGSVVFQVFVDGEERFDSGVMREHDPARPVRILVAGAEELRLVVTDAGDGITCDCANWAEARLTRSASPTRRDSRPRLDMAPFARVVTWDPDRMDGCRSNRVQEFRAEDLFTETEVTPSADGVYTVPTVPDGRGCIGLQWLERRRLRELVLGFSDPAQVPPAGRIQLQSWVGESAWQGNWQPCETTVEQEAGRMRFHALLSADPSMRQGMRKVRWIFPASAQPIALRRLSAFTNARCETTELAIYPEQPTDGVQADIELYDGEIVEPRGSDSSLHCNWDMSGPLRLKVRHIVPRRWNSDRTVIRFRLPSGGFGVAVDDLLANGAVYVKDYGVFVTLGASLADYQREIADRQTILERVRQMPDQSFAQALEKTHNPAQDNGPTMLSLACDNHKFVVQQDGTIQFAVPGDAAGEAVVPPLKHPCVLRPQLGSGQHERSTRYLHGGWLPVPVMTVREGGVLYTERCFVAPYDKGSGPDAWPWLDRKPLFVGEFTIENTGSGAADASLKLQFLSDVEKGEAAELEQVSEGWAVRSNGRLLGFIRTGDSSPLQVKVGNGTLTLSGLVPARASARCTVYLPAWQMRPEEYGQLGDGASLLSDAEAYWDRVMSSAMQVEIPDPMLLNVIRASQVHCLIAARNEDEARRIAPWIASMSYGPLESEANSIVRGMSLMGHGEFARRSLDFFINRYSPEGFLTTGYTLMGTGWHLRTLGEHYQLTRDRDWMRRVAPEVARVCRWITEQREKTKRLDPCGEKLPEYGLMPPGVQADWNAFAYHFALNGYYYAGLRAAAQALLDIGHPQAQEFLRNAAEFREEILRAYQWTQSRAPVYPLKDGSWAPAYPAQLHCPGPTNYFFPGEDANRSWAYDVELGAHQLAPQGVLDPDSREVARMMDHMEDVQFLAEGWFDYPASASEKDWFNLGGFSKVQPYYARNAEIYALRDDVKPFVRSYFNTLASLLNTENLSLWEHFHSSGAWNKTHETGYFLQQTRFMLVMERGDQLWLAPFITDRWLEDGKVVAVRNAPTRFGKVSYRITSRIGKGSVEAVIEPPTRNAPTELVIRLRHPGGKRIRSVTVNGSPHTRFDPERSTVTIRGPFPAQVELTVRY